uniref:Uncharacterized protein n=1 Tax=Arundo donax TaxID=35708 RepID=A0A0A9E418_ARUDO
MQSSTSVHLLTRVGHSSLYLLEGG